MNIILDRHNYFPDKTEEQKRARIQRRLVKNHLPPVKDWSTRSFSPVAASINHGRWIVVCPTGCNNAEFVGDSFPFVCTECGYGPTQVVFPPDRKAIETALLARPVQHNRNWVPDESLDDLLTENASHESS